MYLGNQDSLSRCPRLSSITTRIKTPHCYNSWQSLPYCPRLSSITTRIKTPQEDNNPTSGASPRLSSITTRIKTFRIPHVAKTVLRPRLSSITTRIKTPLTFAVPRGVTVRDYLPLQQGLRHMGISKEVVETASSETIFHYNKD